MSASVVFGTSVEIARKIDRFWDGLSPEHRVALHVAFNIRKATYSCSVDEMLRNAESVRTSVANVRCDFFRFLETHIDDCSTAESIMRAILETY